MVDDGVEVWKESKSSALGSPPYKGHVRRAKGGAMAPLVGRWQPRVHYSALH